MARVFVGNLSAGVREDDLESAFDKFGRIRAVAVKYPQRPPPFAFIEYEDERDASDAVRSMHGREFQGSRLRVEISHSGARESTSLDSRLRGTQYRVKVTNLPSSASWQDLKDFLCDGGDVAHADVDRRGNGVASFAAHDDMERAIQKLDHAELMGERVRIRESSQYTAPIALTAFSVAFVVEIPLAVTLAVLEITVAIASAPQSQSQPSWSILLAIAVTFVLAATP